MCKPVWALAHVLQQCGVPCAELIAKMLSKCGKQPDTPTTAMYLYGTPNESGNIGLRDGDTVTYYDGAVLPELPKELPNANGNEFPCCFVYKPKWYDYHEVFFTTAPPEKFVNAGQDMIRLSVDGLVYYFTTETGTWTESEKPMTMNPHFSGADSWLLNVTMHKLLWTNNDIPDESGAVYLPATEPIPVGEQVDTINDIPIYEVIK